jgi:hypothetical protein
MILSFPGGAGGNWLQKVILNKPIAKDSTNFHYGYTGKHISYNHSVILSEFDYLYSGSYYFNFYINVLSKFFNESEFFKEQNYSSMLLEYVNTARHICKFDNLTQHIFLNFDHLIDNPNKFLGCVNQLQTILNVPQTQESEFLLYRDRFFSTCVDPSGIYENFDNMVWTTFVIGQLMNFDCTPLDFSIADFANQDLCKKFAKEHYGLCKLNKVHHFDTNVHLSDLLYK